MTSRSTQPNCDSSCIRTSRGRICLQPCRAGCDLPVPRDPLRHSFHHLQYRLASYLIEPSAHPFPEDTKSSLVCRLMSSADQVLADAAARQSDIARLGHRLRAGAAVLSSKPHPMAFFRNIATGSDQDASRRVKLAPIDAPSRPEMRTLNEIRSD